MRVSWLRGRPGSGGERARSRVALLFAAVVSATIAVGCAATSGSALDSTEPSATRLVATPVASGHASTAPTAEPTASPAEGDAPPSASMSAEGGDPVAGKLGSYTWGGGGSDSPWLPGSLLTVGAAEPLTVTFDRPSVVTDWSAARAAGTTTDGSGAVAVGSAEGEPIRFIAPDAGRWTVQVQVRFGTGSDTAAYYWQLEVH